MIRFAATTWLLLCLSFTAQAQNSFTISDIRIDGLQRISPGAVFSLLPVEIGDEVTPGMAAEIIRSVTGSQYFEDVEVAREGDVLIVTVQERPSVSEINISGNSVLESEDIRDNMASAEIVEGGIFTRATMEAIRQGIQEVYSSRGRYGTTVEIDVTDQPRNRVAIDLQINEGSESRIQDINVIGNETFEDDELLDLFELGLKPWYNPFSGRNRYSREQLTGDLERLESHYLDNGFVQFSVDSTPISITPDNEEIYITINLSEGEPYTVNEVNLVGDLVNAESLLRAYTLVGSGQTFSQALVTASEEYMTQILGNLGYAFAEVEGVPEIDEEEQTVDVVFYVEPGSRTYVNRINYRGNVSTADDVLRREMRQLESAPASSQQIELSRVRLERLGYFSSVQVDTEEVPGTTDQVDVNFDVEEQNFGSVSFSLGSGGGGDWFVSSNLEAQNFLGTGRRVNIGVNRSYFQSSVQFSYLDPYYTPDGVSRGFSVYWRNQDSPFNIASFSTESYGGSLNFSYPIDEVQQIGFNVGYAHTELTSGGFSVQEIESSPRLDRYPGVDRYVVEPGNTNPYQGEIREPVTAPLDNLPEEYLNRSADPGFIDRYGSEFDNVTLTTNWTRTTLNRGQFPTRGSYQQLSLETTVPGSDLEYYKANYFAQYYKPVFGEDWVLHFRTNLGFGDGYGDTDDMPFFENFFAGGLATGMVRGFDENTLGPRSSNPREYQLENTAFRRDENGEIILNESGAPASFAPGGRAFQTVPVIGPDGEPVYDENGNQQVELAVNNVNLNRRTDAFGGNLMTTGSMELLFPLPFVEDRSRVRSSFFVDVGSVFSTNCTDRQQNLNNCSNFDAGELRYSAGVSVSYLSPFGPLTFYLAKPFSTDDRDDTKTFDFTVGAGF
ncbi:MAG: outer membrane protein assembly factor BamA [Pseudohongiellaceae bacterium]